MMFSYDVLDVELFMTDLDLNIEDLDTMSPVPNDATGDFCLSGKTVRSRVNNGADSIISDSISAGELLRFRFDYQLSNLAITEHTFEAVPIPGAVWLLGYGLLGVIGIRRKMRN